MTEPPATPPTAPTPPTPATAAIILAGGRASRLDGAAKPLLDVGGRTLLDRAVAAVDGYSPLIVVGPQTPTHDRVVWTREAPAYGGPVAGIVAGLALVDTAEVVLLAADLPNAEDAVALLRRHPPLVGGTDHEDDLDGVCLTDDAGRMQWLTGRYRTAALRASAAALPDDGRDASMRSLLAPLTLTAMPAGDMVADIDTWDDLERERARASASRPPRDSAPDEETT